MIHSNLKQVHSRRWTRTGLLAALSLLLQLGACDGHSAADEYERQLEVCSVAEGNGLLDSAVLACGTALRIAEEQAYAPDLLAGLLFRLGQFERQRGNPNEAEVLVRRSLAIEATSGEPEAVATHLIELALILATRDRWLDGAELLGQATPLLSGLAAKDRKMAVNAFRGFSVRLDMLGYTERAAQFRAVAQELDGS
jgi:tetratricopeptide (TPR) repeat protein